MNQKTKPVVAEAISKMKNAMFNQLTGSEPGLHDTCTFTIPVIDLMILEREAIQLERDYEQLREALGFYANKEKWSEWDEPSEFECLPPEAIADSGRIARIALGVSK